VWLLGLDTATPLTTVALAAVDASRGTCEIVAERLYNDPRRHGEVITLLIDEAVDAAGLTVSDLDAVGVGVGPGAFTGLRVGIVTAQALAFGLNKPCFGVCTLDAIAHRTLEAEPFAVITDARRREYFWRSYRQHLTPTNAPAVGDAAAVAEAVSQLRCFITAGTPPPAEVAVQETGLPSAGALCEVVAFRLANEQPLEPARPMYLRSPDVSAPSSTKSVLA
jgi:tRNA threonylcarbamoyl adenosine modification protein YeaZ